MPASDRDMGQDASLVDEGSTGTSHQDENPGSGSSIVAINEDLDRTDSDALDMNIDLNTVPLADDLDNRVYLNAVDTTASEEINVEDHNVEEDVRFVSSKKYCIGIINSLSLHLCILHTQEEEYLQLKSREFVLWYCPNALKHGDECTFVLCPQCHVQKCICRDQQGDSRPHKKARHAPGPCACDHEDIFGLRQCTDRAFFTETQVRKHNCRRCAHCRLLIPLRK